MFLCVFFFKQKTAYEMRISDWSSDVCSSDLLRSVAVDTPDAEDSLTQRRPSTSTSTRLAPRWRRSTVVEPAPTPPPSGGKPKLPEELNLVLKIGRASCRERVCQSV